MQCWTRTFSPTSSTICPALDAKALLRTWLGLAGLHAGTDACLPTLDDALALIVGVLTLQMAAPALGIAGNWVSRRHECQADDSARRMVGAEPMISVFMRLARDNASTLTPDPLYALVNFSHPPVPLRVSRLRQTNRTASGLAETGLG